MKSLILFVFLIIALMAAPAPVEESKASQPIGNILNIGPVLFENSSPVKMEAMPVNPVFDSTSFSDNELYFEEWMKDPKQFYIEKHI